MKATRMLLKVYGEQSDGQWSLICLDFSLAAQADTLEEAKAILDAQIKEYVSDAMLGQDREHAEYLLTRRAPLKYWLKWWWGLVKLRLGQMNKREQAFCEPMPLKPA